MVTKELAQAYPTAEAGALTDAMQAGSPQLTERKGDHMEDYVAWTVGKPEVVAARRDTRERDDGRDDR